jgi:hypothetical protein
MQPTVCGSTPHGLLGVSMGVHDSTHAGQLLASRRSTESTTNYEMCGFCGGPLGDADSDERVEHVLPSGSETRREQYCSPSCFVRQLEQVRNIE